MITLYRASYQNEERAPEFQGLSTDEKPVDHINNGAYFEEIDTGTIYRFDAENQEWHAQP